MAAKLKSARSDGAGRVISENDLRSLATKWKGAKGRVETATGEIGNMISLAVQEKGLRSGPFKQVMKLMKMGESDPLKLRDYIDAYEYYMDALKVGEKAAPRLPFGADAEADADAEKEEPAGDANGRGVKAAADRAEKRSKESGGQAAATSGERVSREEFHRRLKDNDETVNTLAKNAGAGVPGKPH